MHNIWTSQLSFVAIGSRLPYFYLEIHPFRQTNSNGRLTLKSRECNPAKFAEDWIKLGLLSVGWKYFILRFLTPKRGVLACPSTIVPVFTNLIPLKFLFRSIHLLIVFQNFRYQSQTACIVFRNVEQVYQFPTPGKSLPEKEAKIIGSSTTSDQNKIIAIQQGEIIHEWAYDYFPVEKHSSLIVRKRLQYSSFFIDNILTRRQTVASLEIFLLYSID